MMKSSHPITAQRLFIGFCVKKTDARQFFDIQQKLIPHINTEASPVIQSNMHITLAFLGQVNHSCTPRLLDALDKLIKPVFHLKLDKLCLWTQPSIICVQGIADDILLTMADAAQQICLRLDLHQSQWCYQPHVTLFKKASRRDDSPQPLISLDDKLPITISPTNLHLYQSVKTKQGEQYNILHSWPLQNDCQR
ncbi:RNA 2',3'-cyclic phosphodiesterase [Shewanella sp. OMA3-2]|uniref:RNA 2',3'-cyclic phosphodiesterase n=1 Tax=Shewanella sp. OMA3-2 TaxID=2908650 RepID=UPI001F1FCFEF|nr:RNA 2',3'-cyclic phosphodiesterase [Shewanella sp. OMA3-2]UJF21729.1 RNA 2',3'-cyclic phosphodiesterase [Shewanella sp. OMA3-2]